VVDHNPAVGRFEEQVDEAQDTLAGGIVEAEWDLDEPGLRVKAGLNLDSKAVDHGEDVLETDGAFYAEAFENSGSAGLTVGSTGIEQLYRNDGMNCLAKVPVVGPALER
jgi:hypothetical protein